LETGGGERPKEEPTCVAYMHNSPPHPDPGSPDKKLSLNTTSHNSRSCSSSIVKARSL